MDDEHIAEKRWLMFANEWLQYFLLDDLVSERLVCGSIYVPTVACRTQRHFDLGHR